MFKYKNHTLKTVGEIINELSALDPNLPVCPVDDDGFPILREADVNMNTTGINGELTVECIN